jgi:hypothetical protein
MRTRIFRLIALTVAAAAISVGFVGFGGTSSADPITCPPGQAATLNPSAGGWVCVNNGGNTNQSEDPKNPNADKDKF